ncbi:MAG: 23S rRNA (adenine(2030)-N(6))-methyltransferase RlmJ [Gammaproteobacteria bacterium]
MNYRHAFHAGNFADVFKHVLLTGLVGRLCEKPRPVSYVETHAGAGFYRLDSAEAQRSAEWEAGIGRLAGYRPRHPVLARFMRLVAALPENQRTLRAYPGSPLVAAGATRPDDRLFLAELEPAAAGELTRLFRHDRRVAVHQRDGYEALGGLLPPAPRAGLVLMDPPYEAPDDFRRVVAGLTLARRRWPEGVLAAWYPVKDQRELAGFYRALGDVPGKSVLRAELAVRPPDNAAGLNGCGLVVVDPPWGIAAQLDPILAELCGQLCEPGGRTRVDWLRSEEKTH